MNADKFQSTYADIMASRWQEDDFAYSRLKGTTPQELAAKMTASLKAGTGNKDSKAIKATCKALGIKYTYAAIREYLNS